MASARLGRLDPVRSAAGLLMSIRRAARWGGIGEVGANRSNAGIGLYGWGEAGGSGGEHEGGRRGREANRRVTLPN